MFNLQGTNQVTCFRIYRETLSRFRAPLQVVIIDDVLNKAELEKIMISF
ncbi:hypothetical protein AAHB56_00075 [Bacillus thuringiensis]